jgi:hypothetical protein
VRYFDKPDERSKSHDLAAIGTVATKILAREED